MGLNLLRQKKWAEAETTLRECLAIREEREPDAWTTFNTRSLLGEALAGQQRFADAEPLLLSGYEGLQAREAKLPKDAKHRIYEAIERLIALYRSWSKPDAAAKWDAELAKRRATETKN